MTTSSIQKIGITALIGLVLFSSIAPFVTSAPTPEPETLDTYGEWSTTADFDSGTKTDVVTTTDEYVIGADKLQLSAPNEDRGTELDYFRFEDNVVGEKAHYTMVNYGMDYVSSSRWDKGLDADGTEFAKIVNQTDLYPETGNWSMSCWFNNADSSADWEILMSAAQAGGDALIISFYSTTGKIRFYVRDGGTADYITTGNEYDDGSWHHLVCSWNWFTETPEIFIDATDVSATPVNGGALTNITPWMNMSVARDDAGDRWNSTLTLDSLRIYNDCLQLSDAQALYSSNRYKSSGNWKSPYINLTGTTERLNNITYDIDSADASNCIDNTTIIYTSNSTVIGWCPDDITADDVLVASDFTPSNTFALTSAQNISIITYLKGSGSSTPIINLINYTTNATDTGPPLINSQSTSPATQTSGGYVNVSANITDDVAVSSAYLNITYPNATWWSNTSMSNAGDIYFVNSTYSVEGWYNWTIWTNDTSSNMNSTTGSFNITDYDPELTSLTVTPSTQVITHYVNFTVDVTDDISVSSAWANITYPNATTTNTTMTAGAGDEYYLNTTFTTAIGTFYITVWANDSANQWNSTGPVYFNITSADNSTVPTDGTDSGGGGGSGTVIISFEYDVVGTTAYFTYTGSEAGNFTWAFGDGHGSYLENPVHQYGGGGHYNVTLEVDYGVTRAWKTVEIEIPAAETGGTATRQDADTFFKAGASLLISSTAGMMLWYMSLSPMDFVGIFRRKTIFRIYLALCSIGVGLVVFSIAILESVGG